MIAGAGRSIPASRRIGRDRPLADRAAGPAYRRHGPSSPGPYRHAHHVTGATHLVARLDRIDGPSRRTQLPGRFRAPGRNRALPFVEAQEFVEPHVWQARDERDAVADFLNAADLFGTEGLRQRRLP